MKLVGVGVGHETVCYLYIKPQMSGLAAVPWQAKAKFTDITVHSVAVVGAGGGGEHRGFSRRRPREKDAT